MSRWTGYILGALALGAAAAVISPPARAAERRHFEMRLGSGAWLGVGLADVAADDVTRLKLSDEQGAVVKSVEPDSPARKAGVQEGDVILRFSGEAVHSVAQLVRLVRETPPGRKLAIEVSRGGAVQRLSATLVERGGDADFNFAMPPIPPIPPVPPLELLDWDRRGKGRAMIRDIFRGGPRKLGIEYQEISDQLAKYFKLTADSGVLVTRVDDDGPAAKAGLKTGDVLLKFGAKAVADSEDLIREVDRAKPGDEVTLTLQRDGKTLDLKLKLGGRERPRRGGDET